MTSYSAAAPERAFIVAARGDVRETILQSWRVWLRTLVNPDTGVAFTETEIATATGVKSRWWIEADAIDLAMLASQQRGLYLADQVRIDRAASAWLDSYHGRLWRTPRLGAAGAGGAVHAPGATGTTFLGSTTVPDPTGVAHVATDPAGNRYQVLFTRTVVLPLAYAVLDMQAIDLGVGTNIPAGTVLTWVAPPLHAATTATVTPSAFAGGIDQETDAQYARRLGDTAASKQGAGNAAEVRAWARAVSSAVEDAWVYCCALHAGSFVVTILQKRAGAVGPLARVATAGQIAAVNARICPPASSVMPGGPHVVTTTATTAYSDLVLSLAMPRGSDAGWADAVPWPNQAAGVATTITNLTDQQHFRVTIPAGTAAPSGSQPALMVWDKATSRYESLAVTSVALFGGLVYDVVLSAAPTHTLAVTDVICPDTARRAEIGEIAEAYFDSLGPGEVVDLTSDDRASRAWRYPPPSWQWPADAGAAICAWLQDGLGGAVSNYSFGSASVSSPTVPTDPTSGPQLLVLGLLGVYSL